MQTNNKEFIIIITFIVTAVYDIILNVMSRYPQYFKFMSPFLISLQPYFKYHTWFGAAVIAGTVGALCQSIILYLRSFPTCARNVEDVSLFLIITFVISALFGVLMKTSRLFPILQKTMYRYLDGGKYGIIPSLITDGLSGVIVNATLLSLLH
jgi:hypothetical protein